ncbi:MAG: kinase-like domain-containing protein [Linnemannia gamsii]|nr:MAG: kinase-like domain-containing protein [Linnemannia gamsii]
MGNVLTKCCSEDVDLRKKRDHLSKTSPTLRTVNDNNNDSSPSTHQGDTIELSNTTNTTDAANKQASGSGQESTLDGTTPSNNSTTNNDKKESKRPASSFFKQISSTLTKKSVTANKQPHSLSLEQGLEQFPFPLTAEERKVLLSNEIPSTEIEKLSIGVDGGGMGIIHVAEWKGIKVAIKEASLSVITKEVEIYSRMKGCEGVVQFYGVTYPPGLDKLCIVTKYAEFGSLSWYLKVEYQNLDWAHKLLMATQISTAIARLHQEGIYHRDLHSGNILVDAVGNAMLTDFGASTVMEERVAKSIDNYELQAITTPEGESKFTSRKMPSMEQQTSANKDKSGEPKQDPLIGVMAYIAPERFRNPRAFDARCDIYSLGVLLWELTSGHGAFARVAQDVPLAVSILNGKREQPVEGTPAGYQELYESCWETDPANRPTLEEVLATLAKVKEGMSAEELAVTRTRPDRTSEDGSSSGSDFEESVSVPRPTSELQSYIISDSIKH